jgi:hypothetical protein
MTGGKNALSGKEKKNSSEKNKKTEEQYRDFGAITNSDLDQRIKDLKDTIERVSRPFWLSFSAIILVLFLGFVSIYFEVQVMLQESNQFKAMYFKEMNEKMNALRPQLDSN